MVGPLFTAFALIAAGRVEVPPAPQQPPIPQIRGSCPKRRPRLTGSAGAASPARRAWLDRHRQAGRPRLHPDRRRGQARAARGRLSEGQGRPWRHARSARLAACCRSRSARRPSSRGGCSTPTRSMSSPSRFGDGDRHARCRGRGGGDVGQAPDAGRDRGGAAALHRRDRAGPARLFGAEGRRASAPMPAPAPARRSALKSRDGHRSRALGRRQSRTRMR